jgi:hypothetical protein
MAHTRTKVSSGSPPSPAAARAAAVPASPQVPQDAPAPTAARQLTRTRAQAAPGGAREASRGTPGQPAGSGPAVAPSQADFASVGEEITASWGEEKISPIPNSYSSCTTGNFFYKTRVRPGETPEQAFERAYEVVRKMGERFRREKVGSFVAAVRDATRSATAA